MAPPAFVKAVAFGGYHGQLRSLVHLLKYEGMQPVASRLGVLLADSMEVFAASAQEINVRHGVERGRFCQARCGWGYSAAAK